jgi:hypothetical protein
MALLLAIGFLIVWRARTHGFPAGHRLSPGQALGH